MSRDVAMILPGIGLAQRGECRGCKAEIWWVRNPVTEKPHPWNADGTSHFATCPNGPAFRKKKAVAKA